ncbi:NADH-quinone oxidoreductase subunit C [Streptomyces sp. NPDC050803]|uniref:NADH-quinone oxidoreductase subunit C n=1 Tax=unclassified Streptomyces TaxID=2593676 RepID=UPI0034226E00
MTAVGWLPADAAELFGTEATAEESYELLTVDVPPASWIAALETARDRLGCTYFDWLSAVDEPGTGFRVAAHVVALAPVRRLLVRTTVPHDAPVLASAVTVYAGAAWHERETHEMFGVTFEGHPALDHLLLPETFEGHPLRKDFVLAARVAKAWPGAKEPGESEHGGPKRRQMLPPGVPDPNEWGPMKGQLPPAPARPARGAGRAAGERPVRGAGAGAGAAAGAGARAGAGAAGDRPVRRTRTASEGSASQQAGAAPAAEGAPPASPTRRSRSVSEGSASQRTETQPPAPEETAPEQAKAPRSADAPWHHARPAFDEPASEGSEGSEQPKEPTPEEPKEAAPEAEAPVSGKAPEAKPNPTPEPTPDPETPPEDPAGGPQ